MLNKDSINERKILKRTSELLDVLIYVVEIVEYSDEKNIAVCNLTSIVLPRFVKNVIIVLIF